MTFSILLRDPTTGATGAAVCSSSPAVAARCLHLRDGAGVVSSQNVTDPRLGGALLEKLAEKMPAEEALAQIRAQNPPTVLAYRQLLVLDELGNTGAESGTKALGIFGALKRTNVVAGGNMLAGTHVLDALVTSATSTDGPLEQRLLTAMRAGLAAGGEEGPVHSAGLAVQQGLGWRVTDLRVDWHETDPLTELQKLLDIWLPQKNDYITRALNPDTAPSYGVPGDE